MQRILTFANLARWIIGSAVAGATASIVTFATADYVIDERARAVETAIKDLSTVVANLEERVGTETEQLQDDSDALAENIAARVAAALASQGEEQQ